MLANSMVVTVRRGKLLPVRGLSFHTRVYRHVHHRLEAESTSFRTTFEEVRDLLAREYLAETELTVTDIAHLLDYAETANFRRAFCAGTV
jgi:hypothetical protein